MSNRALHEWCTSWEGVNEYLRLVFIPSHEERHFRPYKLLGLVLCQLRDHTVQDAVDITRVVELSRQVQWWRKSGGEPHQDNRAEHNAKEGTSNVSSHPGSQCECGIK